MTCCLTGCGGTTAAEHFAAENALNLSAHRIRACRVLQPARNAKPALKTCATNDEIAGAHGFPDKALIFAGIPRLVHSKNMPSSSG